MRSASLRLFSPCFLILVGCTSADLVTEQLRRHEVQPNCYAGCQDTDPFPDSVGLYINSTVNPTDCADTENWSDTDGDGLTDRCEMFIADKFHPSLSRFTGDLDIAGEPKYAARAYHFGVTGIYGVTILYMPAYYVDGGSDGQCGDLDLPAEWTCPHYGDSEAIILDLYYNPNSQHWILAGAHLSRHEDYGHFCANTSIDVTPWCAQPVHIDDYPTGLAYRDGVPGGAPIIYVSTEKHANYASYSDCTSYHGIYSLFERCQSNALTELAAGDNVGSGTNQLIDCVYSSNPVFSANQECFWSGTAFGGWQNASPTSAPYYNRLLEWGFDNR